MPEFKLTDVPVLGSMRYMVSKQIVSLQNDRGTSYEMYIKVQNELVGAYNDVREQYAQQKFGKSMKQLEDGAKDDSKLMKAQLKAVKEGLSTKNF